MCQDGSNIKQGSHHVSYYGEWLDILAASQWAPEDINSASSLSFSMSTGLCDSTSSSRSNSKSSTWQSLYQVRPNSCQKSFHASIGVVKLCSLTMQPPGSSSASSASSLSRPRQYAESISTLTSESREPSLSETFWETQIVSTSSCLGPCISSTPVGTGDSQTKTVRHPLQIPKEDCSPAKLLAALSLISTSWTGSQDAGFGVYLGQTVTALPFRVVSSPDATVTELLEAVETTLFTAISNQHSYHPNASDGDVQTSTDAQLWLALDLSAALERRVRSQEAGAMETHPTSIFAKSAIVLKLALGNNGPILEATYKTTLVNQVRARRLLWQFDGVLLQLSRRPLDCRVKTIPCLSPQDLAHIREWNSSTPPAVSSTCVHETIAAWAERTPAAEAIDAWDGRLSFKELDAFSSRLAHYLRKYHNIIPGDLVPLCMDRSGLAIVCMLGITKAGAAFVPLDPANPRTRNEDIAQTCGAKKVLVYPQSSICTDRAVVVSWKLIDVLPQPHVTSLPVVRPESLAYVIFTSGSTGRPKGVMIEHRSLSHSLWAHGGEIYRQNETSRVLQFASLAFDASMTEHLAPLSNGGCVCIPDSETRLGSIAEFINENRVNWAFFTPSFFKLLHPEDVPSLRTVVLGGEAITNDCIDRWAHKIRLINGYGPSEGTIVATACVVDSQAQDRSSIGKGITCRTWVVDVDDHTCLVPIGAVGELILQGPSVARGYLNDESKTRASFVETPWWAQNDDGCAKSDRMYKTGDLVRYDDDGSLRYLGRKDTQVKVRGQRLELAEVESHIISEQIQYAAAFVPKAGAYKGSLTVVMTCWSLGSPESPESATPGIQLLEGEAAQLARGAAEAVRNLLSTKLPAFAVPDVWLPIQKMPLNASGKINRNALAQWLESLSTRTTMSDAQAPSEQYLVDDITPVSEAESIIQEACAHVLGLSRAGVHLDRSLQSLGGDSIQAVQILGRCRSHNLQLQITRILKGETIRELASKASHNLVSTLAGEELGQAFCLSPIQRLYVEHMPASPHYFNQTIVVRLKERVGSAAVQNAVREIVKTHSMLRVRLINSQEGEPQQLVQRESDGSFQFRRHSVPSLQEARGIMQASQSLINVQTGPVMVADMIELDDDLPLLSLVVSHFSIDIISWGIILEELETCLRAGRLASAASMPFQVWCRQQADEARKNWTSQRTLPYSLPAANLDFWYDCPSNNTYGNSTKKKFNVSPEATRYLVDNCNSASLSVLDVFLATLFLGFSACFPERQLPVIHSEGHGREPWQADQDISRTVGWFTALAPIILQTNTRTNDLWHTACCIRHQRNKLLDGGLSFFASRFLNKPHHDGKHREPMEVVFNYMGQDTHAAHENATFEVLPEFQGESGDDASDNMPRFSVFDISADIRRGVAHFTFVWPSGAKHADRIHAWADACRTILETAATKARASYPACDLSLLPLDYDSSITVLRHAEEKVASNGAVISMICPASATQQAMLLCQEGNLPFYRTRLLLSVRSRTGTVDISRLASAWKEIVSRHAIFRTVFVRRPQSDGQFDQVVLHGVEPCVKHVSDRESSSHQALLRYSGPRWGEHEVHHTLTVFEGRDNETTTVLLDCSHALIDHMSLQTVFRDLSDAYVGATPRHGESGPYSNLVAFTSRRSAPESVSFWRKLFSRQPLAGYLSRHPSPPLRTSGQTLVQVQVPLSPSFPTALLSLTQRTSLTPALIFRFAWAVLLSRRLQTPAVAFGYVVAGRDVDVPGIENVVGPCLNILGCAALIPGHYTVRRCLEELQAQFLESLPHQHAYLEFAAGVGQGKGMPATTACFDTLVNFRRQFEAGAGSERPALEFRIRGESDPFDVSVVFCFVCLRPGTCADMRRYSSVLSSRLTTMPRAP